VWYRLLSDIAYWESRLSYKRADSIDLLERVRQSDEGGFEGVGKRQMLEIANEVRDIKATVW
jgi:hypothetical protein